MATKKTLIAGSALFGTDGVRGRVNTYPLTPDFTVKLGMVIGYKFGVGKGRKSVVIGKDTRLSGYLFEPALTAGFVAVGVDVILLGPIPTPGVSILTKSLRCDLGIMLSASHNTFEDNGIKIFGPDGNKLSDQDEQEIQELLEADTESFLVEPNKLGRAKRLDDGTGVVRYIEFLKTTFPQGLRLNDIKIVLDCANGASYKIAPTVFSELGANVVTLASSPDGFNINQNSGSLYPESMVRKVKEVGADFGMAFDGDADRIVCCDEEGKLIDGDQILGIIARRWKKLKLLNTDTVVATIMSNLALDKYLMDLGLKTDRTSVGDRNVSERMNLIGSSLGGEQSGHIILGGYANTGDGIMVGLQLLAELSEKKQSASKSLFAFKPNPQLLRNVSFSAKLDPKNILNSKYVKESILKAESFLGNSGRIVVRSSGTENVIRVMVEANHENLVNDVAEKIVNAVEHVVSKN